MLNPNSGLTLDQIKPFLPLLINFIPLQVVIGGRLFPARQVVQEALADGKFDEQDLLRAMLAWAAAPSAPSAPNRPVILPPTIVPTVTTGGGTVVSAGTEQLDCWFEEFWHDYFKGSLPGEPDSDWAPAGSPKHSAITSGVENLPSGASVFVFSGIKTAGPSILPGSGLRDKPFEVQHVFKTANEEFIVSSDTPREAQVIPGLGHIQFGFRGWGKSQGWAFVLRLRPDLYETGNPGPLIYRVQSPGNAVESLPVHITVSGPKAS